MWPIFTNTPLVYRLPAENEANEDVDVQATAISCGLTFQTGGAVSYPICASYFADMTALLNLIA